MRQQEPAYRPESIDGWFHHKTELHRPDGEIKIVPRKSDDLEKWLANPLLIII
jgi:hypothetical protein